jgi:hypothetical protein
MSLTSEINEELAAEIRIQQSVLIVRNMPMLGLGNTVAMGVIALVDWNSFLASFAIIPAVILLA